MKILYLYSELGGYLVPVFQEYVNEYNADVHVIHWDKKKNTPYMAPTLSNVHYYKNSNFNKKALIDFVSGLKPDIVYISGWMDKNYLAAAEVLKKQQIPVVTGFDDIWYKTLRQKMASIAFALIKKKYFTHAWVAGPYQYEYAKRLGFKNNEIIFNLLSANSHLFVERINNPPVLNNKIKSFLFVGRLHEVKGLNLLLDAFEKVSQINDEWTLKIIGNGPLKEQLVQRTKLNPNIIMKDFMQPEDLINEIANSDVFVLPSLFEPLGVVIHEFCIAGMALIVSDCCGAAPEFVIHGYNGFLFENKNVNSLESQMRKIMEMDPLELQKMGQNSVKLSRRITPEISAASFMSVLSE